MLAVGLTQGPPHHFWYLALDRYLPGKPPPPSPPVGENLRDVSLEKSASDFDS